MKLLIPVPPSLTLPDDGSIALGVVGLIAYGAILIWIGLDLWRNRR